MKNRIEKTINAIKKMYGCNENTKVTHILKDKRDNDYLVFFKTRKLNCYSKKMATFTEYCTMNNRYVWGLRVGYFCTTSKEVNTYLKTGNYERVF